MIRRLDKRRVILWVFHWSFEIPDNICVNTLNSILLFLLLIPTLSLAQEIGFPVIRNYTPKEYNCLFESSIIQDRKGLIYFGATRLTQFDGVTWRDISPEKLSGVHDLSKDKSGKIYVAADNEFGYLTTDRKGNTLFASLKNRLEDSLMDIKSVWFARIADDFVYFMTYNQIFRYSPSTGKINTVTSEEPDDFSACFVFENVLYQRVRTKGLMKYENNQLVPAFQSEFFKLRFQFAECQSYNETTLLIPSFRHGVSLYQPQKDTLPGMLNISNPEFLKDNMIYFSAQTSMGNYVLGSNNKGAILIDKSGKILQEYNVSNLLTSNSVLKIYRDCGQNLWFSSLNGISKTENSQDLSYWNKNSGLSSNNVLSIIRHQGTIYIATLTKIFFLDKENRVQEVKNLPTGRNAGFIEVENGKKLLAATPEGIFQIEKDRAAQIFKSGPASTVYHSVKDPLRIFSTTYNNFISFKYQNGKWVYEGMWKGFQDDIRQLMEDEQGDLWIETFANGIIRVKPDYENILIPKEIQHYKEKEGIISSDKNHLFRYNNKIILGTPAGLMVHNRKTDCFDPFTLPGFQYPKDSCYISQFNQSADGKIWMMITRKGFTDFGYLNPKPGGEYDWVNAPFKRIPDMFLYSFYLETNGIAWFCGSEGLYRYNADKDTKNYKQKYNCLIRKVMCNGDSLLYGGGRAEFSSLNLKHRHNSLKFSYAAPFFDQEERTLYSYKLEGYDADWSKWESQNEKEYTNLDEGTYTFRAMAKNIYDMESESDTFQFTIYPPVYRTWWAYALYGLLLFLFIVLIVKAYTRRLIKQKEFLEQVVKERTHEIVLQKEQLQSQTEQLKTQTEQLIITNEKLRELDEFKQGMTSIIVHDLKNPLNLILNTTKKTNPWNQVKVMQESGRQMLDMVLNILDIHKYEETAMILVPENIYLKQIAANAIQQVQFLCEQKDISILNKIDKDHFLKADKEISGRIFINLLTNAIKYTPFNGNILLTSNSISDTFIHVEVVDSGDGIPEDKLHLVFQKFGQIVAKKSGGIRSTGLGLTFCKMAVEAHGGEIGVNSQEGKGTIFWFNLPCGTKDETHVSEPETDITITREYFRFNEEELILINPVIERLSGFTIYETDDVEEILLALRECQSENIQKWIAEIEKNIVTLNQERYCELLILT